MLSFRFLKQFCLELESFLHHNSFSLCYLLLSCDLIKLFLQSILFLLLYEDSFVIFIVLLFESLKSR